MPLPAERPLYTRSDYKYAGGGKKAKYHLKSDPSISITREEYMALPDKRDLGSIIPERIGSIQEKILPFSKGSTLTAAESKELQEPLATALQDYGGYIDKFLQVRTHDPLMPDIWGDLTDMEAQILARIMIRRGQKSPAAAGVVRNIAHSSDYIQAALIIVPRVMRTVEVTGLNKPRRSKAQRNSLELV